MIDSAQALLMAMRKLGVDPEEPNNRAHADRILEYRMDTEPLSVLPQEIFQSVESLWHDPVIPSVMDRSSEFYLMDSATYFFANLRKVGAPDYVPDEADVLRARTKTTGISETRFNMGQLSIHMFDVGGQRSERKKWIHCELPLGCRNPKPKTTLTNRLRSGHEYHLLCRAERVRPSPPRGERPGKQSITDLGLVPSDTPRIECRNPSSYSSPSSIRAGSCAHPSSCS